MSVYFFSLMLIAASVLPAFSQTVNVKKRPTVGLVLSGGGARGFAHIGVLRVLEENHIPVDYVGGASMGALVGAMYSLGYSPDEMQRFVSELDWNQLLRPGNSYDELSFRRKEDRRNIATPITLRGKITDLKLPNALSSGQEIGLLFDRITLPYAKVNDFDNLPIPFRAVATDMVSGRSVVLDEGSLSRSLRATMSIPGIFTPVEIDGKLLADGGLVNNIPTDVVKAMGADILLVVNIETQLADRESLDNIFGILAQTINIASADNSRRSLQQANLIIAPDLTGYSSTDFGKFNELIRLGYDGAKKNEALLKGLALDDADWQEFLAERKSRQHPEPEPVPEFLAVDGENRDSTKTIEEKLDGKYVGKPLDAVQQKKLADDLSELTGTGRFDALDYELTERKGEYGLLIRTNESIDRPSKPTRLEIGFDVNSVESDNVNFNFIGRLTFFDIGRFGTEWRNDFEIGSNTRLASEYYRPIARSKFFVAPSISYERRRINLFNDGNRLAEYVGTNFQAGIDAGYSFNPRSELRVGYSIGYQTANRRIGDPLFGNVSGGYNGPNLRFTYDDLDGAQVPTRGLYSRNSLAYYFDSPGVESRMGQFETRNLAFRPVGQRTIAFAFGGAGTSFGATAPLLQQFTLGGPFRLGGYGFDEFRSSNYIQAGGGFLYNPESFPTFLGGKAYVGAWYEGGSAFERFGSANYRQSGSLGAILETPIGPVFVGTSINENGRGRFYFSFGRVFR